jgi:hypothetical protein
MLAESTIRQMQVAAVFSVLAQAQASESCAPINMKHRLGRLLREVFEGREEHLRWTPD